MEHSPNGKDKEGCYSGVDNTDVTTVLNKYKVCFEVVDSTVYNHYPLSTKKLSKTSCYTYVYNLSEFLNVIKNINNIYILYALSKIKFVYINFLLRLLKISLVKIQRGTNSFNNLGVIVESGYNQETAKYTVPLQFRHGIGQYHLRKMVFYTLQDTWRPLIKELMNIWEKELPNSITKSVNKYQRELRLTRKEADQRIRINSATEKSFLH